MEAVRLAGNRIPANARGTMHTIAAGLTTDASLINPDAIPTQSQPFAITPDFAVALEPYSVALLEITGA